MLRIIEPRESPVWILYFSLLGSSVLPVCCVSLNLHLLGYLWTCLFLALCLHVPSKGLCSLFTEQHRKYHMGGRDEEYWVVQGLSHLSQLTQITNKHYIQMPLLAFAVGIHFIRWLSAHFLFSANNYHNILIYKLRYITLGPVAWKSW